MHAIKSFIIIVYHLFILLYLSSIVLELIIYNIIQWIKQYFSNLNNYFDEYKSEIENENMDCVSIDCTFMSIMCAILIIISFINRLVIYYFND